MKKSKANTLKIFVLTVVGVLTLAVLGFVLLEKPDNGAEADIQEGLKRRPTTLITPFKSYQSVSAAQKILESMDLDYFPERNEVPVADNKVRVLDTLTVPGFTHFDLVGKLTLKFFNDRLYESIFSPEDSIAYAEIMRNSMGLRPNPRDNGRTELRNGNKRIFSNVFYANTDVGQSLRADPYILWQDTRLVAELRNQ